MANRSKRAAIAQETLLILNEGYYYNNKGEKVNIQQACEGAIAGSILYTSIDLEDIGGGNLETNFVVKNETTLSAASRLVNQQGIAKVICLNFASAKNPGGGFLGGSQAQEESLARATGLYPCIAQMTSMYQTNRNFGSALYTDNIIYSPQVPVIRNDQDELLDTPYLVSFITAPAVNAGAVINKGNPQEIEQIDYTMLRRTAKVLAVAAINGYKHLVLGAWGCGVFKNNPENVARYFYHHLLENPKFKGLFDQVVFAVLATSDDRPTFKAFQARFK